MRNPRRPRDSDASALERALLDAAAADRPSPGARARMAAALGLDPVVAATGPDAAKTHAAENHAAARDGAARAQEATIAWWLRLDLLVIVGAAVVVVLGDHGPIPPARPPVPITADRHALSRHHSADAVRPAERAPRATLPTTSDSRPAPPVSRPSSSRASRASRESDPRERSRRAPERRERRRASLRPRDDTARATGMDPATDPAAELPAPDVFPASGSPSPSPADPAITPGAPIDTELDAVLVPAPSLPSSTTVPAPHESIPDEVILLDRVRAAHRAGDTRRALDLIASYDRHHPDGQLRQEVEVLRIEVRLARGERRHATRLARRFLYRFPASPHFERVRALLRRSP